MKIQASELVRKLILLIAEYGDRDICHEDNSCQMYNMTDVTFDEKEQAFRLE